MMNLCTHALLLDLDGTLIQSEAIHVEIVRQWMKELGILLTSEEQNYVIGHAWQDIYRYLHVYARVGVEMPIFIQAMLARKQKQLDSGVDLPVTEGAIELIDRAYQEKLPIAIVSGSSRQEIAQAIAGMNVGSKIALYIGSEDYPQGKPSPECYLLAAQQLSVASATCLVIEDSEAGIRAAKTAGMRVIATAFCNPPKGSPGHQDQSGADKIVSSLSEITRSDLVLLEKAI